MNRFVTVFLLFVFASPLLLGETFTNLSGKSIEADISKADTSHVWLRLKNGKVSKVARDVLSEKDQGLIDEWINSAVPDIKVSPMLARGLKPAKEEKKWVKKQTFELKVNLSNYSSDLPLEETEVIFFLIGRAEVDKKICKVPAREVRKISLKANGSGEVIFSRFENFYSPGAKGFHALNYVLHLKRVRDGKVLHTSSPNGFLEVRKDDVVLLKANDITDATFRNEESPQGEQFTSKVKIIAKKSKN